MTLKSRVARLEAAMIRKRTPRQKTFEDIAEEAGRLQDWLEQHGYSDCLAALEAGESVPADIEEMLRHLATYDSLHRAWDRIEAALAAGELPADGDLELVRQPH